VGREEAQEQAERRVIRPIETAAAGAEARKVPLSNEEAFFASLKPAQLSFAFGFMHMKNGNYDDAAESFYNASLEDPESKLAKVFLGVSLFAVGEYPYAAEYLRIALNEWPEFARYPFNLKSLYGAEQDLASHLKLLRDTIDINPRDENGLLALAFVEFYTEGAPAAGPTFSMLKGFAEDPATLAVAGMYVEEIERRSAALTPEAAAVPALAEGTSEVGDAALVSFLAQPDLRGIPGLPIR
jgi:tetratricopeptide (TPR) repeat protein